MISLTYWLTWFPAVCPLRPTHGNTLVQKLLPGLVYWFDLVLTYLIPMWVKINVWQRAKRRNRSINMDSPRDLNQNGQVWSSLYTQERPDWPVSERWYPCLTQERVIFGGEIKRWINSSCAVSKITLEVIFKGKVSPVQVKLIIVKQQVKITLKKKKLKCTCPFYKCTIFLPLTVT